MGAPKMWKRKSRERKATSAGVPRRLRSPTPPLDEGKGQVKVRKVISQRKDRGRFKRNIATRRWL